MSQSCAPAWYRRYTAGVVVVTAVLIWWGAAVTTENVGMAVPDWPLSFGSVNPEGWWAVPALRLEHGHRLLASLVGLLTLGLCAGAWLCGLNRSLRIAASWAVVLVILQGVLGGMRVLHVSDEFGIVHGCLGQAFFCLLIWILLMAYGWGGERPLEVGRESQALKVVALGVFGAVFVQLVLGAVLRHTQRFYLADSGLLRTGESWFPGWERADLLVLFLHKWWAVAVLSLTLWAVWGPIRRVRGYRIFTAMSRLLTGAVIAQVCLGVAVILTGKSFWVTNFHVINGLIILAASFVVMIFAWRTASGEKLPGLEPERV